MIRRFTSIGMVGRIILVLAIAILLELFGNLALHRWQDPELVSSGEVGQLAARLVAAERVALASPRHRRGGAMHDLGVGSMTLNWVPRTVITDVGGALPQLGNFRSELVDSQPALAARELRLTLMPSSLPGQRDLVGARQLADGSFITFRVSPFLGAPPHPAIVVALHLLLIAVVLFVTLLMVQALARPLRKLAAAADATGVDHAASISLAGPPEIRQVALAFSAMQDRLIQTMTDHTQSLVAVSHDLRTPIQRLKLRASLIDDADARAAMTADLEEMEHFIQSTLDYFRSGEEERQRLVDVAAIAMTMVDMAADIGTNIKYFGPDTFEASTRPLAIKRVLGNLIDNAARHADRIEVSLIDSSATCFKLEVSDNGPGIPPALRERAVLPFQRLDTERGSPRGGAGLGLASAKKSLAAMRGTLTLRDSKLGGLNVIVALPKQ